MEVLFDLVPKWFLKARISSVVEEIAKAIGCGVSSPNEAGKHKVQFSSRTEANGSAARAEVVPGRGTEQDTLQPGAFMSDRDQGLTKEQFDRIRRTVASILRFDQVKVWFHMDEIKQHIFKARCPRGHESGRRRQCR